MFLFDYAPRNQLALSSALLHVVTMPILQPNEYMGHVNNVNIAMHTLHHLLLTWPAAD